MKKIFFITPYPLRRSPSQRFRFEQYLVLLKHQGHEFQVASFLDETNWRDFYKSGKTPTKVITLIWAAFKRLKSLLTIRSFDFIFIHREAMPVGPPIIEWLIAKLFRKKIIYDFDDAIWHTDLQNETLIRELGKWRGKVGQICKWAHKVSCGNPYLCDYARTFNDAIVCTPTIVDTNTHHNPALFPRKKQSEILTIGWTGSHSTIKYLNEIAHILKEIELTNDNTRILVIADQKPEAFPLSTFDFTPWNPDTEIEDLMKIDIGIMPLPDDEWAKGKCGFKIIQYMALEIPAVASPIGVNKNIIEHGKDGFLAGDHNEWRRCLNQLLVDESLRKSMGTKGRKKIVDQYSVTSNASSFLSLFE